MISAKNLLSKIRPYINVIILYFISIIIIKLVEAICLTSGNNILNINILFKSLCYNFVISCLYSIIILPVFLILSLISKKSALIASSVLFSILLLLEAGLTIYSVKTGTLMGSELLLRPVSETFNTMGSIVNKPLIILITISIISCFTALAFIIQRIKLSILFISIFLTIILAGAFFFSKVNSLYNYISKPSQKNYIISKSWYCINSSIYLINNPDYISYLKSNDEIQFPVDKKLLEEFIAEYPNRKIEDYEYPLERNSNNIPDVLSPFFKESEQLPNIVVVIVESLGRELSGNIENGVSFTPFIDSLTTTGLYWDNCFSTTFRSYGAVPAITGSLPYGIKGFQFGIMPAHHSMISILNNNNYQTNTFYGGDITFDNIYDYLIAQDTRYIPNFYSDIDKYKSEGLTTWWGLLDHALFDESLRILEDSSFSNPIFNLYITLTNHEKLNLSDKNQQNHFIEQTEKIISQAPQQRQSEYKDNIDLIASLVYTDESLRNFISNYRKRDDFNNTIFIITGDHASGMFKKNHLSSFHIPIIIWSPLIEKTKKFTSIATHNDITPSIISLLQNKYGLKVPDKIHWLSDGLDTSSSFQAKEALLFLNYARETREILYKSYYYFTKSKWENESILKFDQNIDLKLLYDEKLMEDISKKFLVFKYVNNYTYHNNRLIHNNHDQSSSAYKTILEYENNSEIIFKTPEYKPSEKGPATFLIMPEALIPNEQKMEKINISIEADVYINDSLWIDEYMDLELSCTGDNMKYPTKFKDKVTKFLSAEIIKEHTWYKLSLSKDIIIKDAANLSLSIKVTTAQWDNDWVPNSKLTFKNIKIKVKET